MATDGSPAEAEQTLAALHDRLTILEQEAKKPPKKDKWDKLSIVSTILSGLVIALVGLYATGIYNARQLDLLELQTVEAFFEHLSSEEDGSRLSALDAIMSTGHADLAVNLALNFGGTGGQHFLENQAVNTDSEIAAAAGEAHEKLLQKTVKNLDAELVYRLNVLNELLSSNFNERVMWAVQKVFSEEPPGEQTVWEIGGGRLRFDEYASKDLIELFTELENIVPEERLPQIVEAIRAASSFQGMISAAPTKQIYLSGGEGRGGTVDDVPDFTPAQLEKIKTDIIPKFKHWLDSE